MRRLTFVAEATEPVSGARPGPHTKGSLSVFPRRNGLGQIVGHTTTEPPATKKWQRTVEAAARAAAESALWADPLNNAVSVVCEFRYPVPQVRSRLAKEHGLLWAPYQGDVDKLCRAVLDGLENAKIIRLDARVAVLLGFKYECSPAALSGYGSFGGVKVDVSELPDFPAGFRPVEALR